MLENNIGGAGLVSTHCLFLALSLALQNPLGMAVLQWRPEPVPGPGCIWSQPRNIMRVPFESPEELVAWAEKAEQHTRHWKQLPFFFLLFILFACHLFSAPFYFISLVFPPSCQIWWGEREGGRRRRVQQL